MALTAKEKSERNYRLDHPDFQDVHETTFAKGVIKDFGLAKENPIILDETCTVEVGGSEFEDVPFFYHCRQGAPETAPAPEPIELPPGWEWINDLIPSEESQEQENDDGANNLEDNGALKRGARGFWKGQEVKVLLQEGQPKYVVGHMDHPHRCHNIFQVRTRDWFGNNSIQGFMCSLRRTYGNFNESQLKDQYNKDLNLKLTNKAYRLFGYREFQRGTVILFYGDWLIKMGPVMFILQVVSVGWPGPTTRDVVMLAALYDKDLEQQTIATGKKKETMYPPVIGGGYGTGQGPHPFESVKYKDFVKQTDFSKYMLGYYQGVTGAFGGDTPRWVYTEIYTEPMGYKP